MAVPSYRWKKIIFDCGCEQRFAVDIFRGIQRLLTQDNAVISEDIIYHMIYNLKGDLVENSDCFV